MALDPNLLDPGPPVRDQIAAATAGLDPGAVGARP